MFRHLLVPLDGSVLAESALPPAAALGARFGSEVTLLHVLERRPPTRVHGTPHLRDAEHAEAYLSGVTQWLRSRGVGSGTHVHAPRSDVPQSIAEHAVELGADLVVLCTHGKRGMRGFLYGRIAQQAVSLGVVPVLAVPGAAEGRETRFELSRVLMTLDGTADAEAAVPFAAALVREATTELVLARVVPTVQTARGGRGAATRLLPTAAAALLDTEAEQAAAYLERWAATLRREGVSATCCVLRGEAVREISREAAARRADLIVMATHGQAGVATIWTRSFAAQTLERIDSPVLLVRSRTSPVA